MSSIYNEYISGSEPYERIPADTPPGSESIFSFFTERAGHGGLSSLLDKLGLKGLDSGDLLLLLILYLLLKEDGKSDLPLLLVLAAAFLLDGEG